MYGFLLLRAAELLADSLAFRVQMALTSHPVTDEAPGRDRREANTIMEDLVRLALTDKRVGRHCRIVAESALTRLFEKRGYFCVCRVLSFKPLITSAASVVARPAGQKAYLTWDETKRLADGFRADPLLRGWALDTTCGEKSIRCSWDPNLLHRALSKVPYGGARPRLTMEGNGFVDAWAGGSGFVVPKERRRKERRPMPVHRFRSGCRVKGIRFVPSWGFPLAMLDAVIRALKEAGWVLTDIEGVWFSEKTAGLMV